MKVKTAVLRTLWAVAITGSLIGATTGACWANEFVGVLTLVLEENVAAELGLSRSARAQLQDLVDQRESDAIEIAYEVRDLPKAQQHQKLDPFRRKSEELGLALLTVEQRQALEAIRVARLGMPALGEANVAKTLELTQEQRAEVDRLLSERDKASKDFDRRSAEREQKKYDDQLKALLTKEQLAAWQRITTPHADESEAAGQAAANEKGLTRQPLSSGESTGDGNLRFSFRYAPWSEVIQWFAAQANLSLIMDAPPQGTLNYTDPRDYTPSQAIDLLNSVLLTKGYTLVRRDRMLMLINLEDGIPPNLITEVSVDELASRGEYELVRCLFTLLNVKAAAAEQEISRLIGPQGKVVVLESSNQLLVTETAGRLRTFHKIIQAAERKHEVALGKATLIRLAHVKADDVIGSWRKLMGLTEEENATPDGLLRVAQGKSSRQLLASGQESRVQEFKELVKLLDLPAGGGAGGIAAPQLEVYPITEADPASVLEVMQTLLADLDEVRLASDPKTGNLVALATPAEHRTIKATIDQMQKDRREVAVIRLRMVDPQLAMMSIEKLFGPAEGEEATDPNTPRVDADPTSRSLLIRGSRSQIAEIRELLAKMGEQGTGSHDRSLTGGRGNLRMIPIDAATARRALDQMNSIWPTVRKNQIRIVRPSSTIRGLRSGKDVLTDEPKVADPEPLDDKTTSRRAAPLTHEGAAQLGTLKQPLPPAGEVGLSGLQRFQPIAVLPPYSPSSGRVGLSGPERASGVSRQGLFRTSMSPPRSSPRDPPGGRVMPKSWNLSLGAGLRSPIDLPSAPYTTRDTLYVDASDDGQGTGDHPAGLRVVAPVIVTLGDQGLLIASEDLEALDDFEQVFRTLADRLFTGTREMAVYYLKHAKAEVASELLKEFMGGGGSAASGGGGSLLSTLAGAALGGGEGGGLIGSLLGMGGGGASGRISGGTSIIADPRLNALVVQATPKDLDFIEQILKVLDTSASPEVIETIPRPRTILVLNTSAEEIAEIIRSVYASRLTGQASTPRQPSPEEFIRAMSGQKNSSRTIQDAVSDQLLMNISVDQRRNAIIVVAPDSLFLEVRELVTQLDFATPELRETIRYGQTSGSSPEIVRSALASLIGEENSNAQTTNQDANSGKSPSPSEQPNGPSNRPSPEQFKRQMEFLKAIQGANAKRRAQQAKQLNKK